MRGKRGAISLAAAASAALLLAAPAGATITPVPHNSDGPPIAVRSAFSNFTFQSAAFYTGAGKVVSVPPNGNPIGWSDDASGLAPFPFPSDGKAFLILSSGDITQANQPGAAASADDGGAALSERGGGAQDVTVLQIVFASPTDPSGAVLPACLSFDYRFLSKEYPSRAASGDAFVAELDSTTWTANPGLAAPKDFALDGTGHPITVGATGAASMSPTEAAGTPYGGATAPLQAQTFVPATSPTHTLYLSILDQGDRANDSTVFVDNLRLTAPPGTCSSGSTPLGPAIAITAPSVSAAVDTPTPTVTGTANGTGAVTLRIYPGQFAAGAATQTLTASPVGNTWAVTTGPLAPGQYTAQATQANAVANGVSPPATFTVAQPRAVTPGAGGSQQVGDRDHDGIPDNLDTSDGSLPPIPGKSFDVRVISGTVFFKPKAGTGRRAITPPKGFVPLKGAANVPMGSQLDTRRGRVQVTSAADTGGVKTQASDFYDGIFAVKQALPKKKSKKPVALITDLVLKGEPPRSECAPLKGASAATVDKKKKGAKSVLGKLWGNGKGKFRTTGKYSSATVRGTIWLTADRCDGTLTTVKRGVVSVRDFKRKKTVSVRAGHSYLARAQRAASKRRSR
jgi:hypothetical protein